MNACESQMENELIQRDLKELKDRMQKCQIAAEAATREENQDSIWYFKVQYLVAYEQYKATWSYLKQRTP